MTPPPPCGCCSCRSSDGLPPHLAEDLLLQLGLSGAADRQLHLDVGRTWIWESSRPGGWLLCGWSLVYIMQTAARIWTLVAAMRDAKPQQTMVKE